MSLQYSAGAPISQLIGIWPYAPAWTEEYGAFDNLMANSARREDLSASETIATVSGEHVSLFTQSGLGPMDTGWGTTDFGTQMNDAKLGLPNISGQKMNRCT